MRDIPLFTTDAGVAALTLSEIPYKQEAYIKLLDAHDPKMLIKDCVQFCCAAGAEHIFASGNSCLEEYPQHTVLYKMSRGLDGICDTDAALFPLQDKTLELWKSIYNERMRHVPNAATMTNNKVQEILQKGTGYFVHRDGTLLGIGVASEETVDAVISVVPGEGEQVLRALCSVLPGECVSVEVASTNIPAMRLYERLGFIVTEELSSWYCIR